MLYHILAVGDVVMEPGLRHLERHLRPLQKWKAIDFTVVNGENAAGVGLTRDQAERIYDAGADVVTWRTRPGCCGPPTTPAGPRVGAAVFTTWAASGSGC